MLQWIFDTKFLKKIGVLAIPIALQQILTTSLQFVDSVMISYIDTASKTDSGESIAIASVSFAGQNFFLFILLIVGITSGISIFTAQYWGDKDVVKAKLSTGLSVVGAGIGAILFTIPTFIFAENFISFFSKEPEIISIGGSYLRILSLVYIFTGISFALNSSLKSIRNVKIPITVSILTVGFNTILNYLLIFGKFGFPELGINGAAIATVVSGALGLFGLIFAMKISKSPLFSLKIKEYIAYPIGFINSISKTTLPVIGNEMGWALGIFAYNKVFATIGTEAATAFSIAEQVAFIFMVAFIGTSSSTATLIGNTIGGNSIEEAKDDSKRILILAFIGATLFAIISGVLAPLWASFVYNIESETMKNSITILIICTAITLPFKVVNMHGVNGIMRSGGDTHYSMYVDIGCLWFIGLPIAVISALVLKFPIEYVYLAIAIEEVIKAIFVIRRVRSGKWINRLVSN